jgi:hypothetical protein
MTKRPTLEEIESLFQAKEPAFFELQGPGPFEFPRLSKLVSKAGQSSKGQVQLRLETERGQEVRISLTEEAASKTLEILQAYFAQQALRHPGEKNCS